MIMDTQSGGRPPKKSVLDADVDARLDALRTMLLRLHKVFLDDEREAYEKMNGPMGAPGQVLSLVMSHPWFDYLHRISQLIIKIDQVQEQAHKQGAGQELSIGEEPVTNEIAEQLFKSAKALILGTSGANEFTRRYKEVLKRNPGAVLAHAEVLKTLHDD